MATGTPRRTRAVAFALSVAIAAISILGIVLAATPGAVWSYLHSVLPGPSRSLPGAGTRAGPCMVNSSAESVRPETYGATADGRKDDSTALQKALDAAAAEGGIVQLGAGTYRVTQMLSVPSHTVLAGAGSDSVLHFTWSDQGGSKSAGPAFIQAKDADSLCLERFVLEGGTDGKPSGSSASHPRGLAPGIRLVGASNFEITGLEIRNTPGIGVDYIKSSFGTISGNTVHNTGRDGITGFYGDTGVDVRMTISNNHLYQLGDDGIAVNGAAAGDGTPGTGRPSGFTITGNTIEGWPQYVDNQMGRGIFVASVLDATISGNTIKRTASDGILVIDDSSSDIQNGTGPDAYSEQVTISGNTVDDAGQDRAPSGISFLNLGAGIYVRNAAHVAVVDNTVSGSYGPNVLVTNCVLCSTR